MPDLLYGISVEIWAFPIHCSVALPMSALYQVYVRQYVKFADGFFQIPNRFGHPCQLLMFPINSAHTETCTLLVYYHARHTKEGTETAPSYA